MDAMRNSQLIIVRTDAELQEWIRINVTNIYPRLMIIYKIDFGRVKDDLVLVDLQILFVLV